MKTSSSKRPNVLWLMSDQHNANCMSFMGHPNVKTPNLDKIAKRGAVFTQAFSNNPICSPSRICFITGQYMHTHRMFGNNHAEHPSSQPDSMACLFRRYGYQTGLFGKSHMTRRWDEEGFEVIRYTDLCDAIRNNPETTHYFDHLLQHGLADLYEEGNPKPGQGYTLDGSGPAQLPYEHSIEHFTGNETLKFLKNRDSNRPFYIQMTFQRPHAPISPAREHFDLYNPDEMVLPPSSVDYFENRFAGKPEWMQKALSKPHGYPLADPNQKRLKRCLASYYALISVIDSEIGRVLDHLEECGELDNTIVIYVADHGDFAGEHGLFHKNFGIYDSIQKIPFIISWPGGPQGVRSDQIVESIDLYPTLCSLCNIPLPEAVEGKSILPIIMDHQKGKEEAYCEWEWPRFGKISAIRTERYRLVVYQQGSTGELYDHQSDPGEIKNLWNDPQYAEIKIELTLKLLQFTLKYAQETGLQTDERIGELTSRCPTRLLHKDGHYWSDLAHTYSMKKEWPPASTSNGKTKSKIKKAVSRKPALTTR